MERRGAVGLGHCGGQLCYLQVVMYTLHCTVYSVQSPSRQKLPSGPRYEESTYYKAVQDIRRVPIGPRYTKG